MPQLVVHLSDRKTIIALDAGPIGIGRGESNAITAVDTDLSRNHCVIEQINGRWRIRDLSSRNGTRLNQSSVSEAELKPGDIIECGRQRIEYQLAPNDDLLPMPASGNHGGFQADELLLEDEDARSTPVARAAAAPPAVKSYFGPKPDDDDQSFRAQLHRKGVIGVFGWTAFLLWPVFSLILIVTALFYVLAGELPWYHALWTVPFGVVVFLPLAAMGWKLGDLFRVYTAPDVIFAAGTQDLFWKKVQLRWGPQWLGIAIATGISVAPFGWRMNAAKWTATAAIELAQENADAARAERIRVQKAEAAAPSDKSQWYVQGAAGATRGPIGGVELKADLSSGAVEPSALVSEVGSAKWVRLSETQWFQSAQSTETGTPATNASRIDGSSSLEDVLSQPGESAEFAEIRIAQAAYRSHLRAGECDAACDALERLTNGLIQMAKKAQKLSPSDVPEFFRGWDRLMEDEVRYKIPKEELQQLPCHKDKESRFRLERIAARQGFALSVEIEKIPKPK